MAAPLVGCLASQAVARVACSLAAWIPPAWQAFRLAWGSLGRPLAALLHLSSPA